MRLLVILWLGALAVFVLLRMLRAVGMPAATRRGQPWDPYAVLGVGRGAAPEELTRAYHEQLNRYHPDRVAHLGPELQELAHRKTLDIQRAYAELAAP